MNLRLTVAGVEQCSLLEALAPWYWDSQFSSFFKEDPMNYRNLEANMTRKLTKSHRKKRCLPVVGRMEVLALIKNFYIDFLAQ